MAALCSYALKLTLRPAAMTADDLLPLRRHGLDDRAIVDANQVVSYFNYVNRIADGLGVELEESWPSEERRRRHYPLAERALPEVGADSLPWLTFAEIRELDRMMTDDFCVPLARMSENAGRELASLTRHRMGGDVRGEPIVVLAGHGGNGLGGLAAARQLTAAGAAVAVRISRGLDEVRGEAAEQARALVAAGVPVSNTADIPDAKVVLDALLGYSLDGPPRGLAADLIRMTVGRRVIALDVPSGLEVATGVLHAPHVRAEATLMLAAPKAAVRRESGAAAAGALYVADISVPPKVFTLLGLPYATPFARGSLLHVT